MSWRDWVGQVLGGSPDPAPSTWGYPSGKIYTLDQWASVVLDSSGFGIASLGPQRVKEWWTLTSCWVGVNGYTSSQKNANAVLNIGTNVLGATQMANTINGSQGDTCALGGYQITTGYQVWVQWSNGTPGVTAYMHLLGTWQIGAPGSVS